MYKVKRFSKLGRNLTLAGIGTVAAGGVIGHTYGAMKDTKKEYNDEVNKVDKKLKDLEPELNRLEKIKKSGKLIGYEDFNFDEGHDWNNSQEHYDYIKSDHDMYSRKLKDLKDNPKKYRKEIRDRNIRDYEGKGLLIGAGVGVPMAAIGSRLK